MADIECKHSLLFYERWYYEKERDFDLLYVEIIFILHESIEQETSMEIYDSNMCR
jgi:hypothetical protein